MNTPSEPIDDYLKTFMEEIEALNDNAMQQPVRKRKRASAKQKVEKAEKAGWVPKPADDCPIVSWMENGNMYAVQNPANKGQLLLKMELYDTTDIVYMCGLYLDKDSEVHESVKQVIDKLENMWIDKSTGVPKIPGLTQTVTPRSTTLPPKTKKQRAPRKKQSPSAN